MNNSRLTVTLELDPGEWNHFVRDTSPADLKMSVQLLNGALGHQIQEMHLDSERWRFTVRTTPAQVISLLTHADEIRDVATGRLAV